jgi:hypothetical protein
MSALLFYTNKNKMLAFSGIKMNSSDLKPSYGCKMIFCIDKQEFSA